MFFDRWCVCILSVQMHIFQKGMLGKVSLCNGSVLVTKLSVCVVLGRPEECCWICFVLASKNTDRVTIVFTLKEIPLWMLIPHLK